MNEHSSCYLPARPWSQLRIALPVLLCALLLGAIGPVEAKKSSAPPTTQADAPQSQEKVANDLVELNFRETEIMAVLEFYSKLFGKAFLPSDEINGKITVISPSPLSVSEAKAMLLAVLDMKGFALVEQHDAYKVLKKKQAVQDAPNVNSASRTDGQLVTGVINLRYVQAKSIIADLKPLLSEEAVIFAGADLNYLVITDKASSISKIQALVQKIDQPGSAPITKPYRLQYLKAETTAPVLTKAFTQEKDPNPINFQILPLAENNTLVITAPQSIHDRIAELIALMDKRTAQVSIQAMLVELQLDESSKFGLEWKLNLGAQYPWIQPVEVVQNMGNILTTPPAGKTNIYKAPSPAIASAFTYSLGGGGSLEVLVNMLAKDANARVLSAPHLMVMNNTEASITVGTEIPILKEYRLDLNNKPINTYSQRKFGLELKVTPVVAQNRDVTLKVSQKLSTPYDIDDVNHTYKAAERTADTVVVIKDNQTLIIGGLIEDDLALGNQGMPGLRKIPAFGYLFGTDVKAKTKRELLIFLTPRVIETPEEAEKVAQQDKERSPAVVEQAGAEFDL